MVVLKYEAVVDILDASFFTIPSLATIIELRCLICLRLNKLTSRAPMRLSYAVPRQTSKLRPRGVLRFPPRGHLIA